MRLVERVTKDAKIRYGTRKREEIKKNHKNRKILKKKIKILKRIKKTKKKMRIKKIMDLAVRDKARVAHVVKKMI